MNRQQKIDQHFNGGEDALTANTRLAQWGRTSLIGSLCFYCKFVLADSLVFQNPPLRQAWECYVQPQSDKIDK